MNNVFSPKQSGGLIEIPSKEITIEKIRNFMSDENAKRIHFDSTHKNALKRSKTDIGGVIKLPFIDTISPIIKEELGADTNFYPSKYECGKFYRSLRTNEEYDNFEKFIKMAKLIKATELYYGGSDDRMMASTKDGKIVINPLIWYDKDAIMEEPIDYLMWKENKPSDSKESVKKIKNNPKNFKKDAKK